MTLVKSMLYYQSVSYFVPSQQLKAMVCMFQDPTYHFGVKISDKMLETFSMFQCTLWLGWLIGAVLFSTSKIYFYGYFDGFYHLYTVRQTVNIVIFFYSGFDLSMLLNPVFILVDIMFTLCT